MGFINDSQTARKDRSATIRASDPGKNYRDAGLPLVVVLAVQCLAAHNQSSPLSAERRRTQNGL
jgi:hypothetical protein